MEQAVFDAEPSSAAAVRRFVAEVLAGMPRLDDIALVATELASNTTDPSRTVYTVGVSADDNRIRLEVSDGTPIIPSVGQLADSELGLGIIQGLSDRWGVHLDNKGKKIWAEFEKI